MNKKIQIKHTITDRILEALSLMLTIGTTLYLAAGWDSFPDRIPRIRMRQVRSTDGERKEKWFFCR